MPRSRFRSVGFPRCFRTSTVRSGRPVEEEGRPDKGSSSVPTCPVDLSERSANKEATQALSYLVNCGKGTKPEACDGVFFDADRHQPAARRRSRLADIPDGASPVR